MKLDLGILGEERDAQEVQRRYFGDICSQRY